MRARLSSCPHTRLHRAVVVVAALFGLLSIVAGGRVLLGGDPGYAVYRPLVLFNTLMGAVYLAAALVIRSSLERGRRAAGAIALVNAGVFALVAASRVLEGPVAVESVRAMAIRTLVWIGILLALVRVSRNAPEEAPRGAERPALR